MKKYPMFRFLPSLAFPFLVYFFSPAISAFSKCNGKDREPVKTGTDADVSKVNLSAVAVSIDTMNSWHGGKLLRSSIWV